MSWVPLATSAINGLASVGKAPPAAPSGVDSIFGSSMAFDNSGWNVAFQGSSISAPVEKAQSQGGAALPAVSGNDPWLAYMPYAIGLFGMVLAWKLLKKS
jgi:hypothetical protein